MGKGTLTIFCWNQQKNDDERIANALQNCWTDTPNVLTIWVEFCERFKQNFKRSKQRSYER